MSLTNYGETAALIWLLTGTAVDRPTGPFTIALHTGDPGEDGTANEVVVGEDADYARKTITFADSILGSGQALSSNSPAWTIGAGTGFTLTHISIWESGGDCICKGSLLVSKPLVAAAVHVFNIGDVVAVLD